MKANSDDKCKYTPASGNDAPADGNNVSTGRNDAPAGDYDAPVSRYNVSAGGNDASEGYDGAFGQERLVKSVGLVMLISALARGLSLVGSMRYTAWFGYTLDTDIYSYAINLPNLIFTCIGTALVTVVIPIFSGRIASGEKDRAYSFIDSIITISLILAALVAAAGMLASPLIIGMMPNFSDGNPELALFALRLMFPIMLFHAISYILQGILQTNNRFLAPATVSAFSGIAVIIYISFFAGRFGIRGLLVATFIGLASQALVLIPQVAGPLKYRYRPTLRLSDEDVRLAGRLALPVLVSSSAYQFNMFMNSTFAASFDGGVLTVTNMLTLAFTAAQLFIISTLSVFFPKMSAFYATGDFNGFRNIFNTVMRLILVFAIPASAALAYLSRLLIPLLYGYGKVTESDMAASVAVFSIYAGSIAAIGIKEAVDRAFYAIKDSRTPAVVSIVIMTLNIALSFILMRTIGLIGLPIAYFTAIATGAALLLIILRIKLPVIWTGAGVSAGMGVRASAGAGANVYTKAGVGVGAPTGADASKSTDDARLWQLALKCIASVCIMLATLALAELSLNAAMGAPNGLVALLSTAFGLPTFEQVIRLIILTAIGGITYVASAYAFDITEIRKLLLIPRLK